VSSFLGIIIKLPDEIRVEIGNWAWGELLPRLLYYQNKEMASEEFWRYVRRQESKQSRSRSAFALLAKMAVDCLGGAEVRKRLEELK